MVCLFLRDIAKKRQIEFIRTPKADALTKILSTYEEYYKLEFENEKKEAFLEIYDMVNSSSIVIFIRGPPSKPACRAS